MWQSTLEQPWHWTYAWTDSDSLQNNELSNHDRYTYDRISNVMWRPRSCNNHQSLQSGMAHNPHHMGRLLRLPLIHPPGPIHSTEWSPMGPCPSIHKTSLGGSKKKDPNTQLITPLLTTRQWLPKSLGSQQYLVSSHSVAPCNWTTAKSPISVFSSAAISQTTVGNIHTTSRRGDFLTLAIPTLLHGQNLMQEVLPKPVEMLDMLQWEKMRVFHAVASHGLASQFQHISYGGCNSQYICIVEDNVTTNLRQTMATDLCLDRSVEWCPLMWWANTPWLVQPKQKPINLNVEYQTLQWLPELEA